MEVDNLGIPSARASSFLAGPVGRIFCEEIQIQSGSGRNFYGLLLPFHIREYDWRADDWPPRPWQVTWDGNSEEDMRFGRSVLSFDGLLRDGSSSGQRVYLDPDPTTTHEIPPAARGECTTEYEGRLFPRGLEDIYMPGMKVVGVDCYPDPEVGLIAVKPFGVLVETDDGRNIEVKYPKGIDDENTPGSLQFRQRMFGPDGLLAQSIVWTNLGALAQAERDFGDRGRTLEGPILTPREWIVWQSGHNYPNLSWVGLVTVPHDMTVAQIYKKYVIDQAAGEFDRDLLPNYSDVGHRPGVAEGYRPGGVAQAVATIRMMMDGVVGYRRTEDGETTELRAARSPGRSIRRRWDVLDGPQQEELRILRESLGD